jgi:capsular exopolysaccharide synthesis family protein
MGLSELLAGRAEIDESLTPFPVANGGDLHVLPSGRPTHSAARLLNGDDFRALLEWARQHYELVVVDTPPVNIVADAVLVASQCDGVLLIARSGVTTRDAMDAAMEQLRVVNARVAGAVLNDADPKTGTDVGYGYGPRYTRPAA